MVNSYDTQQWIQLQDFQSVLFALRAFDCAVKFVEAMGHPFPGPFKF